MSDKKMIAVRLDSKIVVLLDRMARFLNRDRSDLIRSAIIKEIDSFVKQNKDMTTI